MLSTLVTGCILDFSRVQSRATVARGCLLENCMDSDSNKPPGREDISCLENSFSHNIKYTFVYRF